MGSSPATRGGLDPVPGGPQLLGLIPGYAGRTRVAARAARQLWAHPRLRGEDPSSHVNGSSPQGSSPATRGGRFYGHSGPGVAGLIPGYAGRTRSASARTRCPSAHPRLRGEDTIRSLQWASGVGSSPATRGGLLVRLHEGVAGGAHPRLRGEDYGTFAKLPVIVGSSPATRGGRLPRSGWQCRRGLIPGYAGRT